MPLLSTSPIQSSRLSVITTCAAQTVPFGALHKPPANRPQTNQPQTHIVIHQPLSVLLRREEKRKFANRQSSANHKTQDRLQTDPNPITTQTKSRIFRSGTSCHVTTTTKANLGDLHQAHMPSIQGELRPMLMCFAVGQVQWS